ncbi:diphthamide biosynthesis protein [Daedaleopsis nitida]|nr:diphthamide biosynthesis protein [Daedaleopsis nitida]
MAENTAFSSSGTEAITRTIDLEGKVPTHLSPDELEQTYDIARTAESIEKGDYKRIALQFPDELLPHSVPIFRLLKSRIHSNRELYVLADTSYGSCCVDEVAAQHVDADALVHYGHACMSQTSRLPVIYVFGKNTIDSSHCVDTLFEAITTHSSITDRRNVVLRYDVSYAHEIDSVVTRLRTKLPPHTQVLYTQIPLLTSPASSGPHRTSHGQQMARQDAQDGSSRSDASPDDTVILYIGAESLALTNILLTHASYEVYCYDPRTREGRLESGRTNKLLMRRYVVVQKARDADVIGILVGTLGVANYLPLISRLREVIKRAHKKSYTISVGKVNPAKLANFLEIECFVLVACPENSLLDAKEFLRPIVTPYELEIALQPTQTWTGRYVLDFEQLLKEQQQVSDSGRPTDNTEGEDEDLDQPVFSSVTGKYRHAKRYGDVNGTRERDPHDSSAVILRNQEQALYKMEDSAAAHFLQARTFRGLETRIGQDAPSLLEQGRSGIARGYADDHGETP